MVVTADPEKYLQKTRDKSGYQGDAIVDVEHKLAHHLKEKGWVDVAITRHWLYAHGMSQPAILVIRRDNNNGKEEILYSWAIVPRLVGSKPLLPFSDPLIALS